MADMVNCCQCEGIASQFGAKTARRELRRFRRGGPMKSTRLLIEDLRTAGVQDASLLDIGGGIGAVHHILLDAGAREAVHVDVSTDYIEAARDESARRGHGERVTFIHGDFVQVAPTLPGADIVALDRVICCYPDMEVLVAAAAEKTRRILGAVYPRDVWWMRLSVGAVNAFMRARGTAFRVFVYRPADIDAELRRHGLARRTLRRTVAWEVVTYERR